VKSSLGRHAGEPIPTTLQALRELVGVTQVEISRRTGFVQPNVSKIESKQLDNMTISTLRKYVAALGGKLTLGTQIGRHRYRFILETSDK
jgi:predicted transcriptional regulator